MGKQIDITRALKKERKRAKKRKDIPVILKNEYLEFIEETLNFFSRQKKR